jgi:DNA-binding IclR family transcriptional regulator
MNPLEENPGRSASNRSLLRGADILRAFRPGSDLLGNGEIAERTGLSASTVSRLTQTLVAAGLLQQDRARRAYRLAPLVLSLGHAMRSGSQVLAIAAPRMRALAERERINVGLAYPDRDEMVYLESIRYNRRVALRNVVSGQRVPMELTSLGRAYLANIPEARYRLLEPVFKNRNGRHWPEVKRGIEAAVQSMKSKGYCSASWQPEVIAISSAFATAEGICVVNVSVSTQEPAERWIETLAPKLLRLKEDICSELDRTVDVT